MLVLFICAAVLFSACAASTADDRAANVAVDLSILSGTVVYSQVYNILVDPDSCIGKIIRMAGFYSAYHDTQRDVVYHSCVIPDATACCAQGFEFVWAGEHLWPEDYPEEGADILVTGRLESYLEDGSLFLRLADSDMILTDGDAAE